MLGYMLDRYPSIEGVSIYPTIILHAHNISILYLNIMKNSILNVEVSLFDNYKSTTPSPVTLLDWLKSDKFKTEVEFLRSIEDDEKQKELKSSLPAISPSGVFSYRDAQHLIEHSGFMSFDIDYQDNRHITNFNFLRFQLSHIPNVAYCGLSVRGKGYWGLIPIPKSTPAVHAQRFKALLQDFADLGINLDSACSDVSRLRIASWDQDAYFNHNAVLYGKIWSAPQREYSRPSISDTRDKVESIISQIKVMKTDITEGYSNWFNLAAAFANEFGEGGRGYFHALSMYHPKYKSTETDRTFDSCLKRQYRRITIGTFFHLAEMYGFRTVLRKGQ